MTGFPERQRHESRTASRPKGITAEIRAGYLQAIAPPASSPSIDHHESFAASFSLQTRRAAQRSAAW